MPNPAGRGNVTIRFHYHIATHDRPHVHIAAGQQLCHVFSDTEDTAVAREELLNWREATGFPGRLQRPNSRRQHFDVYWRYLELCGEPVERGVLKRWLGWSRG